MRSFCCSLLLSCALVACAVNPVPTPSAASEQNIGLRGDVGGVADVLSGDRSGGGGDGSSAAADASANVGDSSSNFGDVDASIGDVDASIGDVDGGQPVADVSGPDDGAGLGVDTNVSSPTKLNVLFLGNSYTYANDLPKLVEKIAAANGKTVTSDGVLKGGWTLGANPNSHAADPESLNKLQAKPWDVVVLQEQSQIPTIASFKNGTMLPGAKKLIAHLKKVSTSAKVVLFLTWGRKNGGKQCAGSQCSADFKDFGQMQDALTAAYVDIAKQVGATVVPVGEAWRLVIDNGGPELFDADGSHPSLAGSYLAACTFHASLFKQSPAGSKPAAMSDAVAKLLQNAAATTVLKNMDKWGG